MAFSDEKVAEMPKPEPAKVEYPQCPKCGVDMDETNHRIVKLGNFIALMLWCKYCKVFLALNVIGDLPPQANDIIGGAGVKIPPFNLTRKH